MAKKTPVAPRVFTEAELFYITEKSRTTSVDDIAETLKCSVDDVKIHIPANNVINENKAPDSMMRNLMGGTSKSGKRGGMAVMTPPASQFADDTRQSRINQEGQVQVQGKNVNCIHKPLGE